MTTNAAHAFRDSDFHDISQIVARLKEPPATDAGSKVVRPAFRKPDRIRPELAGALEAVSKAADLIASCQEQARTAEQEAAETAEQLATALRRIDIIETRALTAEEGIRMLTRQIADFKRDAVAEADALNARIASTEERERRTAEELERANDLLRAADYRVFAAETRAIEAHEDIAYLDGLIRGMLDIAEGLTAPAEPATALVA